MLDVQAHIVYDKVILLAQAEDGQETGQNAEPAERTLITLGLEGVPQGQVGVIAAGDLPGRDPAALITSLEDRLRRLPGHKAKNTAAITNSAAGTTSIRGARASLQPLAASSGIIEVAMNSGHAPRPYRFVT